MTKGERAKIVKAICLINSEQFEAGMGVLYRLCGLSDPAEKLNGLKTAPIDKLMRGPNRKFKVSNAG